MERLLHEERKRNGKKGDLDEGAFTSGGRKPRKKGPCYHCGKNGHYKWECPELSGDQRDRKHDEHKAHKAAGDTSDIDALIVGHEVLSVVGMTSSGWIVDSGATSHM